MTAADDALQSRAVKRRALRETLERMAGPWFFDHWQTLRDLRAPHGSAEIPGPVLNLIMATLVNAGMVQLGAEVCEGNGCPRRVRTYALTAAGRQAWEMWREEIDAEPWTVEDARYAIAKLREQQRRAARRTCLL